MKKVGIDFFTKVRFLSGLQSLGKELLFIETTWRTTAISRSSI